VVHVFRHISSDAERKKAQDAAEKLVSPLDESREGFSIIMVGANPLYQKALKLILNDQLRSKGQASFFLHGCSTVENFKADFDRLPASQRRSVIIFLVDEGNGPASTIRQIDGLKKVNPPAKIIVISSCKNVDYIIRCIEMGIQAYILSDISEELLIDCVCLVAHDQMIFPSFIYRHDTDAVSRQPGGLSTLNNNAPLSGADEKEARILGCLASGLSNKEISRLTGLSDPTVKLEVRKILSKIGAKNRVQAAVWAEKNGYSLDM